MYQDNMATERHGRAIILEYIRIKTGTTPIILTSELQQKLVGDIIVARSDKSTSIELKIEERFTGNVFIETFANREWGTTGWLFTCQSDLLMCYYIEADVLIGVSMQSLRHWLLNQRTGTYDNYRQLRVKNSQPNDTWGIAVPIEHLRNAGLLDWFEAHPLQEIKHAGA